MWQRLLDQLRDLYLELGTDLANAHPGGTLDCSHCGTSHPATADQLAHFFHYGWTCSKCGQPVLWGSHSAETNEGDLS